MRNITAYNVNKRHAIKYNVKTSGQPVMLCETCAFISQLGANILRRMGCAMGMEAIQAFENQAFGRVRTIMHDGEPCFVVADVFRVLGHTNPTMAVSNLPPDERMTLIVGENHRGMRDGAQSVNAGREGV